MSSFFWSATGRGAKRRALANVERWLSVMCADLRSLGGQHRVNAYLRSQNSRNTAPRGARSRHST
jgi:hypothetical protein